MSRLSVVFGIAFLVLAVIVFVFAGGLRRYYSGGFFAVIGMVTLVNALRVRRGPDK